MQHRDASRHDGNGHVVDSTDESRDERIIRIPVHRLGASNLLDSALAHHAHTVGDGQRFFLIMGNEQGGDARIPLDTTNLFTHLKSHGGIKRAERLIEQEHPRLDRQRSRQRHPLLLTARQLVWKPLLKTSETHEIKQFADARPSHLRINATHPHAELQVLTHREMRKQAVVLKHDAHVAFACRFAKHALVSDANVTTIGHLEAGGNS